MSFSAKERRGLLVLGIITVLLLAVGFVMRKSNPEISPAAERGEPYYKSVMREQGPEVRENIIYESVGDTVSSGRKNKQSSEKKGKKKKGGKEKSTSSKEREPYRNFLRDTL